VPRLTKRDRLVTQFGLTQKDINLISSNAHGVWNEIGFDCLQATAAEKGKTAEDITVSRAVVIELVLDADRLSEAIKSDRSTSEAVTKLMAVQYDDMDAHWLLGQLMKETFTYARWGL
jgi:hypothetical protein